MPALSMHLNIEAFDALFKWKDTRALLLILARNPYRTFSITELITKLNVSGRDSFVKAVNALERSRMVCATREGRRRMISINRDMLIAPGDPALLIPQDEYRKVVREYAADLKARIKGIHAVILFGSVARGDADRMSDIDVFVVAEKPLECERAALEIAKRYSEKRTVAKGQERYLIKPITESPKSLKTLLENKPQEMAKIIREGIFLFSDDEFKNMMEKAAT